jgi:hypothetical protein
MLVVIPRGGGGCIYDLWNNTPERTVHEGVPCRWGRDRQLNTFLSHVGGFEGCLLCLVARGCSLTTCMSLLARNTNERNELGDRVQHPQARQFARLGFLLRIKSGLSGCTGKRIESRLTTEEGTG